MESLYYYYFMLNYFLPIWTHKVGLSSFWRTAYCWRIKPLKNLVQLALNRAEGFKNEHDVWYPFISHWPLYLYLLWISVSLVWPSIIRFSLSLTITILLSIELFYEKTILLRNVRVHIHEMYLKNASLDIWGYSVSQSVIWRQ